MKKQNLFKTGLGAFLAMALMLATIGCSGDDNNNPAGPNQSPVAALVYDEITVSLNTVYARYDCDTDPVGVTQPGDFHYMLNVDTLSDNGELWLNVSSNKEKSAKISTGNSTNVSGQSATFRFPRREGQSFRVRMTLREADATGNDFRSSVSVPHVYSAASTPMYAPDGSSYSYWDETNRVGSMSWNVNKRARSYVLGVLTKEGCNATMNYTVTVQEES